MGAFLGVKGSRVQIPPSRPFFEQLFPELGTENGQLGTAMPLWPTLGWLRSTARWKGRVPGRPAVRRYRRDKSTRL